MQTRILRGCSTLFATIERGGEVQRVQTDFEKAGGLSGLDGIFTEIGLKRVLEERD